MVWYRARVKLSRAQAKQAAKISLGMVDDVDLVWINGQPMASGYGEEARVYDVPARTLQAGDNLVVVNVFDMWGSGGLHGPAAQRALRFADGTTVPLDEWEYQLPPHGLVVDAACALGTQLGHQHSLQRHDRAARQVWPARRGVVPGRGERRTRRRQTLPGATGGAVHGLAPAIRISAAVLRGAARQLECARDRARQQWLGEAARCATPRGGRGWQCRARGDHRHRQPR